MSDPVPLGPGPDSEMRKDSSTVSGSIPMLPHTPGRRHCPRARRRRSCCCRRLVGSRSPRRRRRRTGRGPGAAVAAWQHCLVGRAPMAARIGHDWRSSGDQGFYGIGGRWRRSCHSGMLLPEISAMAAANRGRHMRASADTI